MRGLAFVCRMLSPARDPGARLRLTIGFAIAVWFAGLLYAHAKAPITSRIESDPGNTSLRILSPAEAAVEPASAEIWIASEPCPPARPAQADPAAGARPDNDSSVPEGNRLVFVEQKARPSPSDLRSDGRQGQLEAVLAGSEEPYCGAPLAERLSRLARPAVFESDLPRASEEEDCPQVTGRPPLEGEATECETSSLKEPSAGWQAAGAILPARLDTPVAPEAARARPQSETNKESLAAVPKQADKGGEPESVGRLTPGEKSLQVDFRSGFPRRPTALNGASIIIVEDEPAVLEDTQESPPRRMAQAEPIESPTTPEPAFRTALLEAEPSPKAAEAPAEPPSVLNTAELVKDPMQSGPFEVIDHAHELTVLYRRSKLLRSKVDVYRTAVVDTSVCDVAQFTPREISIIGKGQGATHVTFWFEDDAYRPVTYLVRVDPDPEAVERREQQYGLLEDHLAALFPESKVQLIVLADKLVVKGQARDAEEAAQIMSIVRGHPNVGGQTIVEGKAAEPLGQEATNRPLPVTQVINMLRIPGVHQVALRVKIAELNRTAARSFGVDLDMNFDQGTVLLQSLLNAASGGVASIVGSFDGGDIEFGIHYLEQHGVVRILSEPTLVTLSGKPATFIAGGEFAVPTTVGVGGAAAVTTDFRAFGAVVSFRPVVLDKDRIRLEVSPEFSQINEDNTVNGTPGLDTRAVTTTVEMREGQTLAIAGLLDDSMDGTNVGNLPFVAQILGQRSMTRSETELIILVTPELVHPMEPEEVPPLPGFDVTEPTNCEFFLQGRLEGRPTHEYRSTVWPRLRRRYQAGGPEMISGPFGHGD